MTPELIDSYTKLGIAGLLAGALVYVFVIYIKDTSRQRDKDFVIHESYIKVIEGIKNALDKLSDSSDRNTQATMANSQLTIKTSETMEKVSRTISDHNDFVQKYVSAAGGGADHDKQLTIN